MSNTKQEELERRIRYTLDTRHTVPLGQSHTDTYTPRILKLINAEVTAVLDELEKQSERWIDTEQYDEKKSVPLEAIQSIKERYNA